MYYKDIIGYIATIIGVLSFLPVISNIYKTKKTNNFPFKTLILVLISNSLLILSGFLKKDFVFIFMGFIYIVIYSFILFTKLTYTK